jgi:hypothetical protein
MKIRNYFLSWFIAFNKNKTGEKNRSIKESAKTTRVCEMDLMMGKWVLLANSNEEQLNKSFTASIWIMAKTNFNRTTIWTI